MKVYGPYPRKDGRKHVILYDHETGVRRTISYPKYLLLKQGLTLEADDTADHIDEDYTNDSIDNLQVLSRTENVRKTYSVFPERKRKQVSFVCPMCGTSSIKPLNFVKHNRKQGKVGPFCSRRCAGKYGHVVQLEADKALKMPTV